MGLNISGPEAGSLTRPRRFYPLSPHLEGLEVPGHHRPAPVGVPPHLVAPRELGQEPLHLDLRRGPGPTPFQAHPVGPGGRPRGRPHLEVGRALGGGLV